MILAMRGHCGLDLSLLRTTPKKLSLRSDDRDRATRHYGDTRPYSHLVTRLKIRCDTEVPPQRVTKSAFTTKECAHAGQNEGTGL